MAETAICPACGKELPPNAGMCPNCGKGISGKYLLAEHEAKRMAARSVVTAPQRSDPPSVTPIGTGAGVLLVLAVLAIPVGLLEASNATAGVAILSVGAILAIIARVNQAAHHHKELMAAIGQRNESA
jgi:hypothetical protein